MDISLALLTLHVVVVILTGVTASHQQRGKDRTSAKPLHSALESGKPQRLYQHKRFAPRGVVILRDEDSFRCGEGLCVCNDLYADCSSGHLGNQSYIPALPSSIEFLNFSLNHLAGIHNGSFFLNVSNVCGIDLSHNALSYVSLDAFELLRNLRIIFLDSNPLLTYATLVPVFSITTLEHLYLSWGTLGVPPDIFDKVPMPELTTLDLSGNEIPFLDMSSFSPLGKLRKLEVQDNDITIVRISAPVHVEELNLDANSLSDFPRTCENGTSLFPFLSHLSLAFNRIHSLPTLICLPHLEVLDLSRNVFHTFQSNMFASIQFPSLKVLLGNGMGASLVVIKRNAFRSRTLSAISLESNHIDFSSETVDPDSFSDCVSLKSLQLSGNNFSGVSESRFRQLFVHLQHLEDLDLSHNRLKNIHDGVFDNLRHLESLDLSFNQMQRVSESTFGPGTRQRLQSLDISGNPFQCSRRLSWFCHWLKDDPDLFNVSRRSYQCANKPNVNVTSVCSGGAVHVVFAQLVNDATLSMIFGGGLLVVLHNSLSATAVGM